MDKLDIKIIRELFQPTPFAPSREGQRKSFRRMGKKLGVSGEAVAKRVDRLSAPVSSRGSHSSST
jgi:DNA-binding Lrp family transcriptional regulator